MFSKRELFVEADLQNACKGVDQSLGNGRSAVLLECKVRVVCRGGNSRSPLSGADKLRPRPRGVGAER